MSVNRLLCCCDNRFEAKNLGNSNLSFKAKIPLPPCESQSSEFGATSLKIMMSVLMLRIFTNVMQGLKTSLVFPLTACCSASFTAFKQCFLKEMAGFLRKVTGHIRLFFSPTHS